MMDVKAFMCLSLWALPWQVTFPGLRTREAGCRRPSRLKDGAAQTVLLSVGGPLINEANIGMP